jgi:hypothetical protein
MGKAFFKIGADVDGGLFYCLFEYCLPLIWVPA